MCEERHFRKEFPLHMDIQGTEKNTCCLYCFHSNHKKTDAHKLLGKVVLRYMYNIREMLGSHSWCVALKRIPSAQSIQQVIMYRRVGLFYKVNILKVAEWVKIWHVSNELFNSDSSEHSEYFWLNARVNHPSYMFQCPVIWLPGMQ